MSEPPPSPRNSISEDVNGIQNYLKQLEHNDGDKLSLVKTAQNHTSGGLLSSGFWSVDRGLRKGLRPLRDFVAAGQFKPTQF
jgi:hypothetical protein